MKTKLLLFIMVINILLRMELSAQDYHPLIRSNTYWDVMKGSSWEPCVFHSGGRYFFEGDTILDGLHYSIVRAFPILSFGTGGFCPPYAVDGSSSYIAAYMREDTIAKKVFIYDEWFGDALLYDFSLGVNDTLISPIMPPLAVDSIGYVTLLNGEQRKIFHFLELAYVYYIEGLGGSYGLINTLSTTIDMYNVPGCVLDNGVSLIDWGFIWGIHDCYLFVGINEFRKNDRAFIYPNPAKTWVNFSYKLTGEKPRAVLEITNAQGKMIHSVQLNGNEGRYVWDTRNIVPGMYYYTLKSEKSAKSGKLIISR